MNINAPLWQWSVTALAKAIREKQVSSREVVRAHLERIAKVNGKVNALTVILEESALAEARAADERLAAGHEVGPLHGVPVTIKENIDLMGSATTQGIVAMKNSMPRTDAPVVAYLKQAGAIPIGRTNMPDYGLRWHTDNDLNGATLNPWDPCRTPGGSSGGEGAAIATGMSPLGVGNDMGGSVRYPAQCCGIAALKPSLGRISRTASTIYPDPPRFYEQTACVNGPMARHIMDLRLALDVMSRPDPGDPWWTPALRLGANTPGPIRVAVTIDPTGAGCHPSVAAGIHRAATILSDAGYAIKKIDPPRVADSPPIIECLSNVEIKGYLPEILPIISRDARNVLEGLTKGEPGNQEAYMAALADRYHLAQEWNRFMARYSLVLGPVCTQPPFKVGADLAGPEVIQRIIQYMGLTEICNLLGLPSVAVPVQVKDGLPQGVQLIAPRFYEDLCLAGAAVIEEHQGVFTPIDPRDAPSGS